MNQSKSLSHYYDIINSCIINGNYKVLSVGNKYKRFRDFSDILNNNFIDFEINKSNLTISFKTKSKIYFINDVDEMNLKGLKFNVALINE